LQVPTINAHLPAKFRSGLIMLGQCSTPALMVLRSI